MKIFRPHFEQERLYFLSSASRQSRRRSLSEVSTTSSVSNTAASGEALDHLLGYSNDQFNSVDVEMGVKTSDMSADY
ncbi:hypothetical protein PoB_002963000 [Plakobranchus ocellatus]|uniref:Uncharacterized protein n=1 Tax=Plakobranchus ocellatus TaxID=259542 RepID=A0AAV4A6W3_9GAST|nr:hypothetical protein PoB_002963000 [Plakobranchus ocellatus]